MKKILLVSVLVALVSVTFAQSPIGKDGKQFNCGLGLSGWGVPVYLGLDFGIHPDMTMGAEMSYRHFNDTWYDNYNHRTVESGHSAIGIAGNFNYHFNTILEIPQVWDFYAGLNVGYFFVTSNSKTSYNSGLGLGLQVGGRYYFSSKAGVHLELGGPLHDAGGKVGLSFKL